MYAKHNTLVAYLRNVNIGKNKKTQILRPTVQYTVMEKSKHVLTPNF